MFEIDKHKFGSFVSELRRDKGVTQKELAEHLFISSKAISKWETGINIPDISLLVPLADYLGVSVTELLMCKRMEVNEVMDSDKVEGIVKTAIAYSEENPERAYQQKGKWRLYYGASVLIAAIGLLLNHLYGELTKPIVFAALIGVVMGAYFCLFVKMRLPAYYDENKVTGIHDGVIRMNIPGVRFNNSNWPHIICAGRVWSCLLMALFPVVAIVCHLILPDIWRTIEKYVFLTAGLGGLIIPLYIAAKKYE